MAVSRSPYVRPETERSGLRADVTEIGLCDADEARPGSAAYREAFPGSPQVPERQEMHEVSSGGMIELVEQVVAVKGPVQIDEVTVRLRMT